MQELIYKGYKIVKAQNIQGVEIIPVNETGSVSFEWFPDVKAAKEYIDMKEYI